MPTLDSRIDDIVVGNAIQIVRTISDIPDGATLTKAWLTIKEHEDDADSEKIIQKAITTNDVPGTGQITDATAPDGAVRFDLTKTDTNLLAPGVDYVFDVKVLTNSGDPYTGEKGILTVVAGVTDADS